MSGRQTAMTTVVGVAAAMAFQWPAQAATAWQPQQTLPTYSAYSSHVLRLGERISDREFSHRVASVYASLLADQQPLGAEFERVLMGGLGQLYES